MENSYEVHRSFLDLKKQIAFDPTISFKSFDPNKTTSSLNVAFVPSNPGSAAGADIAALSKPQQPPKQKISIGELLRKKKELDMQRVEMEELVREEIAEQENRKSPTKKKEKSQYQIKQEIKQQNEEQERKVRERQRFDKIAHLKNELRELQYSMKASNPVFSHTRMNKHLR